MALSPEETLALPFVSEATARGFLWVKDDRVTYKLHRDREYNWADPEEWVRAAVIAFLIVERGYPPKRLDTEVQVPRRVPNDWADIVLFSDDRCTHPYLVVECKPDLAGVDDQQGIEQAIGNAHSLRAPLALYTRWVESVLFDTSGAYGAMERTENRRGDASRVPSQYSAEAPQYAFIAKQPGSDITPADERRLENKVRRTHSLIWAGGKRDPLTSFDEWSKLLFAKVHDERTTPNGSPRRFQAGAGETDTAVASRIHTLFQAAAQQDLTIFPEGTRIDLPDEKITAVVRVLQDVSITDTDADTIGRAFEHFFGSVFRGELGQYFTMRQIARFTVAAVEIGREDYVIDPAAGSGGFLLEALLQGWHSIERDFAGNPELLSRNRYDFAMLHVFGIEIHRTLARILKINLLLHHDGHTNIEGDRSCLDTEFANARLATNWRGGFDVVVGNPPFGDNVSAGDRDLLGANTLDSFTAADGRTQVPSEHVILERGLDMLRAGGRLAFVVPDGLLNNQGEGSNCPGIRRLIARTARIEAIVSLPDYAFRKSGAQNKTSILFLRKYTAAEQRRWAVAYREAAEAGRTGDEAIHAGLVAVDYRVFLAEANFIGYTATGQRSDRNELYVPDAGGLLAEEQTGSVLGELRAFRANPEDYAGRRQPDCISVSMAEMWSAHASHRLDPKYFIFKAEERATLPVGWIQRSIGSAMQRRTEAVRPEAQPDDPVVVLTVSNSGELRPREAGKGRTPPEWRGMYFEDMPTKWFRAHAGDVVFSGIDLWKGCISVVPAGLDGALVSGEFPVYEVTDDRLDAEFLSTLLRSRYYQRAFRAITTGHSNRRRTQESDFESLEICFPEEQAEQGRLVADVVAARGALRDAGGQLREAMLRFSDVIDRRGDEEYELVEDPDGDEAAG